MNSRIRRAGILLGLITLIAVGSYAGYQVGGRVGFLSGFAAGSVSADTTNAAFATFALRSLRDGDPSRAIAILEQSVDGATLAYWGYLYTGDSEFDRSGVVAKSHEVMRKVADYRKSYPPVSEDEGVLESINEALAYIDEHR
jgi:hypothetical protein